LHPGSAPIKALADAVIHLSSAGTLAEPEFYEIRRERTEQLLRRSSFGLAHAVAEMRELEGKSTLFVVDQFEEIFRYGRSGWRSSGPADTRWHDETVNFVQLLLEATRNHFGIVYVLITMRSDFIGDCAQFYGLPEAVSGAQFLVPSLTRDQREEVIRKPLTRAGATIEPALVERMLNDLGSDVDQLPVLAHTLSRLWERADAPAGGGRRLSMAQYDEIGGVRGALSQHAEEVMASLPAMELAIEQTFRALSETDRDGRATRRALPFRQLVNECGVPEENVHRVLDRFRADDCSFIVPSLSALGDLDDNTRVDVVHEALLRNWTRIGTEGENVLGESMGWLEAEAADGRYYRAMLALLEAAPRGRGVTLPLEQVAERWEWWKSRPRTEAWAARYGGRLSSVEALFKASLAAMAAKRKREAAEERDKRERFDREAMLASAKQSRVNFIGVAAQALVLIICAIVFTYAILLVRSDRQIQANITKKNAVLQSSVDRLSKRSHHSNSRAVSPAPKP
jgi:hypothetical protein